MGNELKNLSVVRIAPIELLRKEWKYNKSYYEGHRCFRAVLECLKLPPQLLLQPQRSNFARLQSNNSIRMQEELMDLSIYPIGNADDSKHNTFRRQSIGGGLGNHFNLQILQPRKVIESSYRDIEATPARVLSYPLTPVANPIVHQNNDSRTENIAFQIALPNSGKSIELNSKPSITQTGNKTGKPIIEGGSTSSQRSDQDTTPNHRTLKNSKYKL